MKYKIYTSMDKDNFIAEFISLPKRLYSKNTITQNEKEERELLSGTHILSRYFSVTPFIAVDENGKCLSRCAVTVYPDDDTAFLGLFESENNIDAVREMLAAAENFAKNCGIKKLVGPVDCSFWIKYRFKTNRFGKVYTGEPYNLPYYTKLWQECGYKISEKYSSNHFAVFKNEVDSEKCSARLEKKLAQGYSVKSIEKKDFDKTVRDVYSLLIELYSKFPAYKKITEDEFAELYGYFGTIIRPEMIKIAYFGGKLVGFFIGIPDYGNVVYGKLTLSDYIKFFRIKAKPKRYIMLYMGADKAHRGLGGALAEAVRLELRNQGAESIGALIRDGNSSKNFFSSNVDYEYHYVLLEKFVDVITAEQ